MCLHVWGKVKVKILLYIKGDYFVQDEYKRCHYFYLTYKQCTVVYLWLNYYNFFLNAKTKP